MPGRSTSLLVAVLAVAACGSMKSPSGVADKFVDKYYVESDQQAALQLADGLAKVRLEAELKLVGVSRRGVEPGLLSAKVYYDRASLEGEGGRRGADYALHIKPQGGAAIERKAHLDLEQKPDGSWRVVRFSETTPR